MDPGSPAPRSGAGDEDPSPEGKSSQATSKAQMTIRRQTGRMARAERESALSRGKGILPVVNRRETAGPHSPPLKLALH